MYYSLFSHIDMFLKKQGIWKSNYIFILLYYIASYLGILRIVAKFLQHHDVYSSFFKNHLFLVKLNDFIFNFTAMIFVSPFYTHFFLQFSNSQDTFFSTEIWKMYQFLNAFVKKSINSSPFLPSFCIINIICAFYYYYYYFFLRKSFASVTASDDISNLITRYLRKRKTTGGKLCNWRQIWRQNCSKLNRWPLSFVFVWFILLYIIFADKLT